MRVVINLKFLITIRLLQVTKHFTLYANQLQAQNDPHIHLVSAT